MNGWQRWWRAPGSHPLHRLLFVLHLWLGLALALYIVVMSLSGSAIVLRPQLNRWHRSGETWWTSDTLLAVVEWLTRLHNELLLDRESQYLHGIGGLLLLVMLFSGLLLWWRGSRDWWNGFLLRRRHPRSLLWQLHSCVGIWTFFLTFVWGFSALYFAWQAPFDAVIDWMDEDPGDFERPDGWLLLLLDLHFGRFRGVIWASILWIVLGLAPALMALSGLWLWLRRRRRLSGSAVPD